MHLTRRNLLFGLGAAAAATAAAPVLLTAEPLLGSAATKAAARSTTPEGLILLSRNENAYGPFASVQQAMRDSLVRANRYTFGPDYSALVDRITRLHGVDRARRDTLKKNGFDPSATFFFFSQKIFFWPSPSWALGHYRA